MPDDFLRALAQPGGTMFQGRPVTMSPDMNLASMMGVPGPEGMMLNMVLQPMLGKFLGDKFMSSQFMPMGNLYNQYRDKAAFGAQQEAMRRGSEVDRGTYVDMFAGMAQMAGTPFGVRERRAANTLAGDLTRIMPMIAPMAPELFDRLHGSRGSALIMAQQMNLGGRYAVDPVTGRTGMTGESVADMTKRTYDRLYGPDADVNQMKGLGAGRAGQLYDEMSRRGLAGSGLSRDDAMTRVAAAQKTTVEELRKLDSPALDIKLRQFEADRIADKLKSMAGAVSAMQDIFGEMGQPDAPMSMLMNGLQMLTQNGLQSMSPQEIERMVRTTSNVARAGGMDMTAMMQLVATAAQRGDQLGLDRRFAATGAQGAAAFGTAYGNMAGGMRRWGMADKDKATALAVQLETNAAASPIAQQLATVMRLQDEFGGFKAGSEAEALQKAIAAGDTEYSFDGKRKSVYLPSGYGDGSFIDVMQKGGMRGDVVEKVRYQSARNQQTIAEKNLTAQARALQGKADIEPRLFQVFSSTAQGAMTEDMRKDPALVDAFTKAAADVARQQLDLAPEDTLNADVINKQMLDSFKAQGVAVTPEMAARIKESSRLMIGNWEERVRQDPGLRGYGSGVNALLMNNRKIMDEKRLLTLESDQEGRMQSAFAQLGRAGPAQRLADALLKAGPATNFNDVVAGVFGFQDKDEVARVFGTQLEELKKESEAFRNVDPAQIRKEFGQLEEMKKRAADMPFGDAVAASATAQQRELAAKYGVRPDQVMGMTDRNLGIAAREATMERSKRILSVVAPLMEKHGFAATKVTTGDVNRATTGLRAGRGGSLDDLELLTERLLMDDKSMGVLGEGGLDRIESVRARSRRLRELAAASGVSVADLLSGKFTPKAVDVAPEDAAQVGTLKGRLRELSARGKGDDEQARALAKAAGLGDVGLDGLLAQVDGTADERAKARGLNDEFQAKSKLAEAAETELRKANETPGADTAELKKKASALRRESDQARGKLLSHSDETGVGVGRLLMSDADLAGAKKSKLTEAQQKEVRALWTRGRDDAKTQGDMFEQLQKLADSKYGGNMLGLLGDPELAKAFVGNERRALEVMSTDLGMSFSKGVDRSAGFTDDYKTRMKDVQRQLSLDSKGAVDELLQLTGSRDAIGETTLNKDGKAVKGSDYLTDKLKDSGKLQDVLPALKRMQELGLTRQAAKELGAGATPEALKKKVDELRTDPGKIRESFAALLDAKDEDLTPEQRAERKRLNARLGGDPGLAGVLKKVTSGTATAEDIEKAVGAMPDLRRDPPGKAGAAKPSVVTLSPESRFAGTFDITTGKMDMRPIGQMGT